MFEHFYHGLIRKYIVAFGNLFNDITVQRFDKAGERIQSIIVPISYGPKEKFLSRITQDPNFDSDVAITIPRIGFEITSMNYSPTRKLSSVLKNVNVMPSDGSSVKSQFTPVPYDINMSMSIFVKNADDGAQIVEQIIPYFRPEFTTRIRLVPEMDIVVDTPIVLQSVSLEDAYDGSFDTRRALIWMLDFVIKGYVYGPVSTSGVIKRAITNLYSNTAIGTTDRSAQITVTPTLTADGWPVPIDDITAEDDYDFATDITEP
jgi:hypothetical protein